MRRLVVICALLGSVLTVAAQRPWGDSYAPRSARPAEHLRVVPLVPRSLDERVALCCLQGLIARQTPELWLERNAELDAFWLDWHKDRGYVKSIERVADWQALFKTYADRYRGAVVADPTLYRGRLIALNVAACEDMIVATPALAEKLGIGVKIDLRQRFDSYADGMRWVWQTYKDKLTPYLCDFREPKLAVHATFDLAFQWRGLMVWLTGPREAGRPGVDAKAERELFEEIFAELADDPVCIGFPAGIDGQGHGLGEPQGVELISRYGMGLICTNHRSNYSVLSSFRQERLSRPKLLAPPKLDAGKIYVALNLSDGDNQILWPKFFRNYFEHEAFGSFPLAFDVGPAIRELQPAIAEWHYRQAPATVEFIAGVSGASYINPDAFGTARPNRDQIWNGYLQWTLRLMQNMDLQSVRTVKGKDDVLKRYVAALPESHSIFADMGRYSGHSGIKNLTYTLNNKPIFRSVTSWRYGKNGFLKEVRDQVGDHRPAFVNGFVHCWTFAMDDLVRITSQAGDDFVFVTPSQLAALYQQAQRE